jgi:excisionase family DNA binding protein
MVGAATSERKLYQKDNVVVQNRSCEAMEQYYTIGELARVMHTDESSVRLLLSSGILKAERCGTGYLLNTDEFSRFGIISSRKRPGRR